MYNVNDYGRMMADPARLHAYTEALRRAVKPGNVVVDVGTGLGVFAFIAAKLGASKVYAIDVNPCVALARETARANGLSDRIEFIQENVFDVRLPARAEVLVGDCRGAFPLFSQSLEIMAFARKEFLAPGGAVIAQRDDLLAALVYDPDLELTLGAPWNVLGLDWSECRRAAFSSPGSAPARVDPSTFATAPAVWATLDYRSLEVTDVHGAVETQAHRTGPAHAICTWFRSDTGGAILDGLGSRLYKPLLLPLDPAIDLQQGERVQIKIDALKAKDAYLFAWEVASSGETRRHVSDWAMQVLSRRKIP